MQCKTDELNDWESDQLSQLIERECSETEHWRDREERTALPSSMSDLMF